MYKNAVRALGVALLLTAIVACEDEIGSVGSGVVDQVNFEAEVSEGVKVVAYSKNFRPEGVQTNELPTGVIGIYDDPVYGITNTSILSQVILSNYDPDFGQNTVLDSVVFSMPYFSRSIDTDEDGAVTYEIDSIFRNTGEMKLSVYRSDYFLNDLDPDSNFEDPAFYFSNDVQDFSGVNDLVNLLFEKIDFEPINEEVILTIPPTDDEGNIISGDDIVSERLTPRLRLTLDNTDPLDAAGIAYWKEAIIDRGGEEVLLNANSFNNYFKGLYIQAESTIADQGSTIIFDPALTNITLFYSFEEAIDITDPDSASQINSGSLMLNLGGVSLVNYENDFSVGQTLIGEDNFNENQNIIDGESSLYLKGGDGSIVIVDLFGEDDGTGPGLDEDDIPEQLEDLRSCNIIINEANLVFYVDQEAMLSSSGILEPERVFIYNLDENAVLIDNVIDNSSDLIGPIGAKTSHLGRLVRAEVGNEETPGVSYKIRVTQQINEIIKNEADNVRLAVSVSQNVTLNESGIIGGSDTVEDALSVPLSSIISPEGTIVFGNNILPDSPDYDKRLKLVINYTIVDELDPNSPCAQALSGF